MLFSIPSQYYCAIGLELYLGLALDRAIFVLHIRGALLWEQLQLILLRVRAFHPLWGLFPEASPYRQVDIAAPNITSLHNCLCRFDLPCTAFNRLY